MNWMYVFIQFYTYIISLYLVVETSVITIRAFSDGCEGLLSFWLLVAFALEVLFRSHSLVVMRACRCQRD